MKKILIVALCVGVIMASHAQDKAIFNCTYDKASQASFNDGKMTTKLKKTKPFSFSIEVELHKKPVSAKMVGNLGSSDLIILPDLTRAGYTFLEKTDSGNVMQTVIYTKATSSQGMFSVHSRHLVDMNMASQYYGFCI